MSSSYVYVIRGRHGSLKVGTSRDPMRRLSYLQNAYDGSLRIYGVWWSPNAALVEAKAHAALAHKRAHGEWFECDPMEAAQAVMRAVEEVGWPKFIPTIKAAEEARGFNEYPVGYARDLCETALSVQKAWLLSSGVDQSQIVVEDRRATSYRLFNLLDTLTDEDRLLVYSRDVLGVDEACISEVLKQIDEHGAAVTFGCE